MGPLSPEIGAYCLLAIGALSALAWIVDRLTRRPEITDPYEREFDERARRRETQ